MYHTRAKGLTVSTLRATSDRRIIDEIVSNQIKSIDAQIQTAHTSGFNKITYELPTNFQINNMSKTDAQTMIYSEILSIYKNPENDGGKGFDKVYIDIGSKSILYIEWLNGMDEEEREQRRKIIQSCFIKRKN